MIRVEQLSKRFGTTVALDNVSLEVSAGEIVGLLGPNGAGKTTMMRLLTGYLAPTSGRVSVAGVDVQEHPLEVRRRIGYLPETVPVYAEMTVASYLDFVAELRDLPPRQNASRIRTVMERAGVAEVSGRLIGHLSKGYRQRVGLAQALLHNPDILILDEPTVGLDPSQVVEIRQLIRELALEHTVILSSHILPEVSQICSQVVIIDRGHIVASGTQDDLERRLKGAESLYVEMKADKAAAAEALAALAGVHTVQPGDGGTDKVSFTVSSEVGRDVREDLFRMAASRNWPILELRPVSMSLEEVFSRLTRQEEAQS